MVRKKIIAIAIVVVFLVSVIIVLSGTINTQPEWNPGFPFDKDPHYTYTVRLWEYGPNTSEPNSPVELHELSATEITNLGEETSQNVSILRYDTPNPTGKTVWGIYHEQLDFVLWYNINPDENGTMGRIVQVGETAKDTYNADLTPAQNDAAGNIDWFRKDNTWYPRTLSQRISSPGDTWTESWGPFDPDQNGSEFRQRNYSVSEVPITLQGKNYTGIKITIVGPSEADSAVTATEALTFIKGIGWYERYFDYTLPTGTMIFKHIATLQEFSFG